MSHGKTETGKDEQDMRDAEPRKSGDEPAACIRCPESFAGELPSLPRDQQEPACRGHVLRQCSVLCFAVAFSMQVGSRVSQAFAGTVSSAPSRSCHG